MGYHDIVQPTVARHFPSLSNETDNNLNIHMFTEDISLAIMPIGGHTTKQKAFSVSMDGDERECEKAKQLIREMQYGYNPNDQHDLIRRHDLNRVVCDVIENIVRHLSHEGCSVHEIIFDDNNIAHLYGFTSRRLLRLPGYFLQLVPKRDRDLWEKNFVLVPSKRIWYFEMPPMLGGRKGYKAMIKNLGQCESLPPNFWSQDLEKGLQDSNFDFQEYVRMADIYCGQVTKTWGWNRRDLSQERSTEFFVFYRLINFHWALAVVREHIVKEINTLFKRLNISCKLKIDGLPTPSDILNIRREMQDGRINFTEAFNQVSM